MSQTSFHTLHPSKRDYPIYRQAFFYLLVVVQHGVHVLDPDGIHGAIEKYPLKVRDFFSGARADKVGQYSVLPERRIKLWSACRMFTLLTGYLHVLELSGSGCSNADPGLLLSSRV